MHRPLRSSRATPSQGGRGERTRARLLAAAIQRFGRDGYRATSVAAITRDLGMSPPLAFSYFTDKEALFLAAFDADVQALLDEVAPNEGLGGWLGILPRALQALPAHPLVARVLRGTEQELFERLVELPPVRGLRDRLEQDLRAAQESGLARRDVDAAQIATGLHALLLASLLAAVQSAPAGGVPTPRADFVTGVRALITAAIAPIER